MVKAPINPNGEKPWSVILNRFPTSRQYAQWFLIVFNYRDTVHF